MSKREENIGQITDSVLNSVKKQLGLMPDNTEFDAEIIMHINSAFFILSQLGVGPGNGFHIEDETTTYNDYLIGEQMELIHPVKMYLYYKTKLGFDISSTAASIKDQISAELKEIEWRLLAQVEMIKNKGGGVDDYTTWLQ